MLPCPPKKATSVSTLGFACGFFPGAFVVHWLAYDLHLSSTLSQLGFVFTAVLVNFLCRKFVIFKG